MTESGESPHSVRSVIVILDEVEDKTISNAADVLYRLATAFVAPNTFSGLPGMEKYWGFLGLRRCAAHH